MEKIIDPVSVDLLRAELTPDRKLCDTNKSGNEIYVVDCHTAPNVLQEIGRLREIAFRDSGGGTGQSVDLDDFDFLPDRLYRQIVIWDPEASAILGRSFVAPEYQSSKAGAKAIFALDNLWDGLAAIMLQHPDMMYYFGKMTIYPDYDKAALDLIEHFLWKHFPDPDELVRPWNPYPIVTDGRLLDLILREDDFKQDYRNLKDAVRRLGTGIPPLVNSYMNASPTMKMFGCSVNDEFFDAFETGILIGFDEMYADKRDRHKDPYFKHLAQKIWKRGSRRELPEIEESLSRKSTRERMKRFNAFLNRQKEQMREAEQRLRSKVQRKNKKEKVEP